ncbi:MAG: MlaD family protein [Gemmatimonadales bacterium]
MDLHYKQEVTVGLLVLVGAGLFLGGTMWLKGTRFSSGDAVVRVEFPDAGTLKKGSPVRVSGVSMGSVDAIEFESIGKVAVTLRVKPVVAPRIDATARLATVGLVADAIVNYHPGTASEPLPEGRTIQGVVDQGITELGTELGEQAKTVMTGVNEIANKRLADNLNATLEAMQRFMAIYGNSQRGPTAEMTATMQSLQRLSGRLDSTLAQAALPGTLRRSDTLMANLSATSATFTTTTAQLDTLLQRLNRGQGTMGRLMTDSLLYGDMHRVAVALEKLIEELRKNPGKITIQVKPF